MSKGSPPKGSPDRQGAGLPQIAPRPDRRDEGLSSKSRYPACPAHKAVKQEVAGLMNAPTHIRRTSRRKRASSLLTPRRIILLITIAAVVWVGLVVASAGIIRADELAQLITAITTVFYSGVFAFGYYMMIQGNQQTLKEMREERLSVDANWDKFLSLTLAEAGIEA
jgi:hypothetical protein